MRTRVMRGLCAARGTVAFALALAIGAHAVATPPVPAHGVVHGRFARSAPVELRVRSWAGQRLAREWTRESRRTLTSLTVLAGGESTSDETQGVGVESVSRLRVVDTIESVAGDRPLSFVRAFDAIERTARDLPSPGSESAPRAIVETCDLAGHAVRFHRPPATSVYARTLADASTRSTPPPSGPQLVRPAIDGELERLTPAMDLAEFLPAHAVAMGASWSVPIDAIRRGLLHPGGEFEYQSAGASARSSRERELAERAWDALAGACQATFTSSREVDGARLCVIRLEGEFTTAASAGDDAQLVSTAHSETFAGELLWNAPAGRAHSLRVHGRARFTLSETTRGARQAATAVDVVRTLVFDEATLYRASIAED